MLVHYFVPVIADNYYEDGDEADNGGVEVASGMVVVVFELDAIGEEFSTEKQEDHHHYEKQDRESSYFLDTFFHHVDQLMQSFPRSGQPEHPQ